MRCRLPGKCAGTQARTMPIVEQLLPPHRHHVVVFGCMLGELLGKDKPSLLETVNDLNRYTTNFYLTLKYDVEALIERLMGDPYSQPFFRAAKEQLARGEGSSLDLAEAYALVANQSFGNADPTVRGVSWGISYRSVKNTRRWEHIDRALRLVAHRLRCVQILDAWPWEKVLDRFDGKDVLFTVDPPYHPDTLRSQTKMYRHTMTAADHERLLIRLHELKASWMLFGYDCELYRHYLPEPLRLDQPVSISSAKKKPRCEKCIWVRY